jgi:asparagine synthase (glutamine-hydrolysing)
MDRPKKPFIAPLTIWFKDDLREQLKYYLSEEKIKASGFFNPAPIQVMLEDYLAGRAVNYQKIWQLLVFQLWYDRWISPL